MDNSANWFVYILACKEGSLYTGITNNLERRLSEHRQGKGGHYTKAFGAVEVVYQEKCASRSIALQREAEIKSWPREKKLALIRGK